MPIRDTLITLASYSLRLFFRERAFPRKPKTILVLKPCCLGDVINATPALAGLRHHFPAAQIDVVVGSWSRPALLNNPHIRRLVDSGRVGQGRYTLGDVRRLSRRLRPERYEAAVVLDRSPLVGLAPALAGIPHRAGLDSRGRGFAHTVRVPVPREPRHEALIYLACLKAIVPESPLDFWTEFHPTAGDQHALEGILLETAGSRSPRPLALLHPGGGVNPGMTMPGKRWPPDRFAALGDRLAEHGLTVALTGSADDAPLCAEIAVQMQRQPLILAGQLTLGQFGALCQTARLLVGGDTGGTHLAAACGCPTAAIFGPSDPARYAPFAPPGRSIVLWRETKIPSGGVAEATPGDFDWERGISVEEVWAACLKLLGEDAP
ncbi:MAG: glycosyltransferase family 9 protein [Anaerolineae bacterium]